MWMPLKNVLIVGDDYGVPELLERVPCNRVAAVVAAGNRPQYHDDLKKIADDSGVVLIIQPSAHHQKVYDQFIADVAALEPDGLLSHSYSMLIRSDLLNLVNGRAFNIHASLLPRNRGPNPVQWALIHGEDKTGVTLHIMDEGIDSGDIIDQEEIEILVSDTWVTLMQRVKSATYRLMDRALPHLLEGDWHATPQNVSQATANSRITPESFPIDFSTMTDVEVFNLIRAQVAPLAGVYLDGLTGRKRFLEYMALDQVAALRQEYANNV